jgi:aminopeptidase S
VVLHTTVGGVTTDTALTQDARQQNRWSATGPATTCGENVAWSVEAFISDGTSVKYPAAGTNVALSATGVDIAASDACETAAGWVVGLAGDNATAGLWVNADPVASGAQPEDDHSANGTRCWITANGAVGAGVGTADVDGGTTTLTSPAYSLGTLSDPYVSYFRWYSNNQGSNPNSDSMPIQISGNGGTTWVQLELVTENAGAWVERKFRVLDFVTPTANTIKLRFIARDLGLGSVVEAGVDDVAITEVACPSAIEGDLDGDGLVGAADIAVLLLDFGPCGGCASDLDQSGAVDSGDIAFLLLLFTS